MGGGRCSGQEGAREGGGSLALASKVSGTLSFREPARGQACLWSQHVHMSEAELVAIFKEAGRLPRSPSVWGTSDSTRLRSRPLAEHLLHASLPTPSVIKHSFSHFRGEAAEAWRDEMVQS